MEVMRIMDKTVMSSSNDTEKGNYIKNLSLKIKCIDFLEMEG